MFLTFDKSMPEDIILYKHNKTKHTLDASHLLPS